MDSMLDTGVVLKGRAMDAHAGAVVLLDDGQVVYLDGVEYWDSAVAGKAVEVSGVLRRKKLGPDPSVDSRGLVSHGIDGTQLVVDAPSWSVVGS